MPHPIRFPSIGLFHRFFPTNFVTSTKCSSYKKHAPSCRKTQLYLLLLQHFLRAMAGTTGSAHRSLIPHLLLPALQQHCLHKINLLLLQRCLWVKDFIPQYILLFSLHLSLQGMSAEISAHTFGKELVRSFHLCMEALSLLRQSGCRHWLICSAAKNINWILHLLLIQRKILLLLLL